MFDRSESLGQAQNIYNDWHSSVIETHALRLLDLLATSVSRRDLRHPKPQAPPPLSTLPLVKEDDKWLAVITTGFQLTTVRRESKPTPKLDWVFSFGLDGEFSCFSFSSLGLYRHLTLQLGFFSPCARRQFPSPLIDDLRGGLYVLAHDSPRPFHF